jgi:hypothetical protein
VRVNPWRFTDGVADVGRHVGRMLLFSPSPIPFALPSITIADFRDQVPPARVKRKHAMTGCD